MKRTIAVILSVAILLFAVACGEPAATPAPTAEDMGITIAELVGTARTMRGDGTAEALSVGSQLDAGDSIITDRDSTVDLKIAELDTLITVSPSSEILFNTASADESGSGIVIVVRKGSISNSVDVKLEAGDIYEVCTGDMTMAIRGTDAYVEYGEYSTSISLLTGYALVYNYYDGFTYIVPSGVTGTFVPDDKPSFELIDLRTFAKKSEAAEAMMKNAREDNLKYFDEETFERELRDSYRLDGGEDYSFSVTSPLVEREATTTTSEVTTTTTSATTAEVTTTTTRAATKTTAAATAPTTAVTSATEVTSATDAAPSVTEPSVTEPSETEPSETEPTSSTTKSEQQYMVAFLNVYNSSDSSVVTSYDYTELISLPATVTASKTLDNGQIVTFTITVDESNVNNYSSFLPLSGAITPGEYFALHTNVMVIKAGS